MSEPWRADIERFRNATAGELHHLMGVSLGAVSSKLDEIERACEAAIRSAYWRGFNDGFTAESYPKPDWAIRAGY